MSPASVPPSVYIFTGPTLSREDVSNALGAKARWLCLPPVSQGDVLAAARRQPFAIGIVDGYFSRIPAVWHKEILWALSQGIHVFGSASMGAIRAAELEPFGMEGVGVIFESFRSGEWEDDDEVAVVHGNEDSRYRQASVAMVNIRATLASAREVSVIDDRTYEALLAIGKNLYYPMRTYAQILARGGDAGLPSEALERLKEWLPAGEIDLKRRDALEMLRLIGERASAGVGPKRVEFRFQHTEVWDQVQRAEPRPLDESPGVERYDPDAAVDELRLLGDDYLREEERAMSRAVALALARARSTRVDRTELRRAADALRHDGRNGPNADADVDADADADTDTDTDSERLAHERALVERVHREMRSDFERRFRDHLRDRGRYSELVARARLKQRTLAEAGIENPSLEQSRLSEDELWRWYFEERLARNVPDDLDAHARELGFDGREALRRAVLREYCFARLLGPEH